MRGGIRTLQVLRRLDVSTPTLHEGQIAFTGSVWRDPASGIIVGGEWVPDSRLDDLRRSLDIPLDTSPFAVVAALFCHYGIESGAHLPGMFALAVYEPRHRSLTLLRDPVGGRTLYYAVDSNSMTDGSVCFASRLRSLRHAPIVGGISLPALRDYLSCAYVPGGQTLIEGVHELRPGSAVVFPRGNTYTYWTPRETVDEADDAPLEYHAAKLRPIVAEAVENALPPAPEPVASYLSGGVDSSLVTALAAQTRGGKNIHTFAIHFGTEYPNELAFSQMVADHCQTRHTVIELPPRLILQHLHETIRLLDDPIGDPLTVPNWLLGQAAHQVVGTGGTILNGEGGDPVFGGPKNGPMLLHELYTGDTDAARIEAYFRSYQKCYDDLPRLPSTCNHR